MIDMADRTKKGYVDIEDFIALMRTVGLIADKEENTKPAPDDMPDEPVMVRGKQNRQQDGGDHVLAEEEAAMNARMARK